jgi:hypothetical protein
MSLHGVTSEVLMFTGTRIFSEFIVILRGGISSRMGCDYDHMDDYDNDDH